MIPVSTDSKLIQQGGMGGYSSTSFVWEIRVESWYNGVLLHDDIPVEDGTEYGDRTSSVPTRVTLSVPRTVDNVDWSPLNDDYHPLACNGQRLRIMLGVQLQQHTEWIQRGEYLITSASEEGDTIRVEALSLLKLVEEARFVSPFQPTGTLKSTLRALMEPALTVVFDAALTDRAVPAGINYDEDRLGAVNELLSAWPAEMKMVNEGYAYVYVPETPSYSTTPVATFTDTEGTTFNTVVIDWSGEVDREGVYNCVVARGTQTDGGQVQGVAYDYSTGAHRIGGPFNPLPVPEYFASPLLTTVSQCRAAATTRLARRLRERRRPLRIRTTPVNFLELGDVVSVEIVPPGNTPPRATIEAFTLPLVPGGDQAMDLLVGVVQ